MSTEVKCNCQHCSGHISFPVEMQAEPFVSALPLETPLSFPASCCFSKATHLSKQKIQHNLAVRSRNHYFRLRRGGFLPAKIPTKNRTGQKPNLPNQTKQTTVGHSQNSSEQTNLKSVVGALGCNLGDVLPTTFQVATNDDIDGITYNFDPPAEIGEYPLSSCYLILTEDRRIAAICADGPENDYFNVLNFKKILKRNTAWTSGSREIRGHY